MKNKIKSASELAYIAGLVWIAIGTSLTAKAGFGVNIVVAPAYIIHLAAQSTGNTFFTFGVCQYLYQGVLLAIVALICWKFKKSYIFAFISAVIEGYILDLMMWIIPDVDHILLRLLFYVLGQFAVAFGISFMLKTYFTPEVYELAIIEFKDRFAKCESHYAVMLTKTLYDCSNALLGIALSFLYFGFGNFVGIGIGTIVSIFVSGLLVGACSKLQDAVFDYKDILPWRKFFE